MVSRKPLPDNIDDEIRKKFSRILEIEGNINRAIQECDRGVPLLSTLMESLKEEHDELKHRLQTLLRVLTPTTITMAQNLEVSQMEREFYFVLDTADNFELQIILQVIGDLCKEEEELDDCRKSLLANFGVSRKTELSKDMGSDSESAKRREKLKDISSSLKRDVGEDEKKIVDEFRAELDRKVSVSGKTEKQSLESGKAEKTLEDVIVEMYGFRPNVVKMIAKSVADRNMIKKSTKKKQPQMILPPEDAGALNWETVDFLGQKFEALKYNLVKGDKKLEILRVIRDWVFHLECNFSLLVHDLHGMMLVHVAAAGKFQELKSALEDMKSYYNGLVPISVYKVLAMQEIPCHEGENSEGNLYKYNILELDPTMDLLVEIIGKFRFLLIASGVPKAKAQNIKSEVLISYEKAVKQSQEAMKEIERKMKWAKSNDQVQVEAPAGKGKMIMS